jgi:hypothetical protein
MFAVSAATRALHFSKISPTAVTVLVYLVCGLLRASALNRRE